MVKAITEQGRTGIPCGAMVLQFGELGIDDHLLDAPGTLGGVEGGDLHKAHELAIDFNDIAMKTVLVRIWKEAQ